MSSSLPQEAVVLSAVCMCSVSSSLPHGDVVMSTVCVLCLVLFLKELWFGMQSVFCV